MLPDRIILVRHAQSEGNVNQHTYTYLPDPQVPLVSEKEARMGAGLCQRRARGGALVQHAQSEGNVNQHTYTYLPDPQVPLVRRMGQGAAGGGVPLCWFNRRVNCPRPRTPF